MIREIQIDPFAPLSAALLLLTVPLPWIAAAVCAALIHEAGHAAAVILCGGGVTDLSISGAGMKMYASSMGTYRRFLCILAGPTASLLLVLFRRWFPRLAVCALIQGCYNLLPILPLDGGNAVYAILQNQIGTTAAECIMDYMKRILLLLCLLTAIVCSCFFHSGAFLLCVGFLFIRIGFRRKIPCKEWKHRVQ